VKSKVSSAEKSEKIVKDRTLSGSVIVAGSGSGAIRDPDLGGAVLQTSQLLTCLYEKFGKLI
jgi:hypothetical protein